MKILAIYGSNTGNTKALMTFIKQYFSRLHHKLIVYNVADFPSGIIDYTSYDLIILSSPTWGGIEPTLQDDFKIYWQHNHRWVKDKNIAVVGLGNLYYQGFCKAVDIISDDVIRYHGKLVVPSLCIPDDWIDYKPTILEWLNKLADYLNSLS